MASAFGKGILSTSTSFDAGPGRRQEEGDTMANERTDEMTKKLTAIGGLFDYGPQRSQLLVLVWRALASGGAVTPSQIGEFVSDVGIAPEYIDLNDFDNVIKWLVELARAPHPYTGCDKALHAQFKNLESTYGALLRSSVKCSL